MNNIKKLGCFILLLVVCAITINCFVVKADSSTNIIEDKDWNFSVSNSASGTMTSTDSSNFKVDMSSIGTNEWDVKVSMDDISLESGETYVYEADITSNKKRINVFVTMYDENGEQLYSSYLVSLDANKKTSFKKVFTAKKDYDNVTIAYGIGYNGYETSSISPNVSNVITVENSVLKNAKDYDYSSLEFTELPKSQLSGYENYYYSRMNNIDVVQTESRGDFGIDTICVNITTKAIASSSGIYEVYLNDVKTQPYAVEIGVWYHLDYTKLIYEYNVMKTIDEDGEVAIIVIKNGNVTDYRNTKLAELATYESDSNTEGVNSVIKEAKEDLNNATTIAEIDTEVANFKVNLVFRQKQDAAIQEIESLVPENVGDNVEIILEKSVKNINRATTENEITVIINDFKTELPLEHAKDEAIETLINNVGEDYSDSIKFIIEHAIDDINEAATVDEVNSILSQTKTDVDVQEAKEKAIETLTNFVGENSSKAIKVIYEKAIEDINKATTVDEVNTILQQAKNNIKVQKEKEAAVDNPLTVDNIILSLLMVVFSIIGIMVLKKNMTLKKDN